MPSCQTPSHCASSRIRDAQFSAAPRPNATVHEIRRPPRSPVKSGNQSALDWDRIRPLLGFIAVFAALGAAAMIYAYVMLN